MARVKEAKGRMSKGHVLKGRRAAGKGRAAIHIQGEIPRASVAMAEAIPQMSLAEIQRTLLEAMLAMLEGRINCDEMLKIGMVAEEQIKMLDEEEAAKGPKVEGSNGESKSQPGSTGEEAQAHNRGERATGKERFGRWVN